MKIAIIGSPGAGKSTLARELGDVLKIEVIHLDRHFWQPKWKEKPRDIRKEILRGLVQKEQWIIEGTYLDTADIRVNAADIIIFLDMPALLCFWRALNRYFKYLTNREERRADLPEGCRDKLGMYYSMKVLGFPLFKRKWLYKWLHELENEKKVYAFRSPKEVEGFLQRQKQEKPELESTHALKRSYAPVSVRLA